MNLLLGGGEPLCHESLHRVTRKAHHSGQLCLVLGAKALQHIVGHRSWIIRSTNPHTNARKVGGPERSLDIFEPIVSGVTAAKLQAHHTKGQIEVIVNDHELLRGNLVKGEHRLNGSTRAIHVARQRCQAKCHPRRVGHRSDDSVAFELLKAHARRCGAPSDHHLSDVVTGVLILRTRITEPYNQPI